MSQATPTVRAAYEPRTGSVLRLRLSARQLSTVKQLQEHLSGFLKGTPSRLIVMRRALEVYAAKVLRLKPADLEKEAEMLFKNCRAIH